MQHKSKIGFSFHYIFCQIATCHNSVLYLFIKLIFLLCHVIKYDIDLVLKTTTTGML